MRVLGLAVLVVGLSATEASAAHWSLGTNLGVTVLSFDQNENDYSLVGVPSQGFLTLLGPPGLRFGIAPEGSAFEVFFDSGLSRAALKDASFSTFQLSANLQYNFANGSTHPYIAVGAGLSRISDDDFLFSSTHEVAPTFGAGLGVRHRLHHGYGTLRAEVHYDRLVADQDELFFLDGNAITLKLGFDLWGN
jgi:hypothetical protein